MTKENIMETFECPHCGAKLTDVSLELHRLQQQFNNLELTYEEILSKVFDSEELGNISDRQKDGE
jgi:transcription initiation factor IIE alpha subunit